MAIPQVNEWKSRRRAADAKMETFIPIVTLLTSILLGAMSPGPSSLLVARTAISSSRRNAIAAALGMGFGSLLFAIYALVGLQFIMSFQWLMSMMKIAGGFYLICLGIKILLNAKKSLSLDAFPSDVPSQWGRCLRQGFFTQISNPKTAVMYSSIFVALLPMSFLDSQLVMLAILIFLTEAGWYCVIAVALSSEAPQSIYLKQKSFIDQLAGGILCTLGIKLIVSE